MALIGIIVNYSMTTYMSRVGREINSPAITSDAKHQRVDIFTCIAIFAGVIGSRLGIPILDPIVALFIVALVLKTAFDVARDNINNIMGKIPSDQLLLDIESAASSVEGVSGVHSTKINYVGPYASVDIHIGVDPDLNVLEAHEISIQVEKRIIEQVEIVNSVSVHICITGEKGVCFD